MSIAKPKLAIIATHPIQHFVPVYQRLVKDYNIALKVFYIGENGIKNSVDKDFGVSYVWDLPLLEGYEYEFVNPGEILHDFGFKEVDCPAINKHLNAFEPDAVWLNGYWARVNWRALLSCGAQNIIYTSDSNLQDHRSGWKKVLKQFIVRFFLQRCHHYVSVSEQNRRYLEHYGAPSDKIYDACYPIDMQRLLLQRDALTVSDRLTLREQYGIAEDAFVIIFSGKLIDHKRPLDLVRALAALQDTLPSNHPDDGQGGAKNAAANNIVLLFMGDGEQREDIVQLAQQHGVSQQVAVAGFVNQSDIARHLFAADVLALPSRKEPFGAVVSEALPFGLPIIAADQIGAVGVEDSAQPERNAIVYPWGDIPALAAAMQRLYLDIELYQRFRQHSFAITQLHDADVYCQALLNCLGVNSRDVDSDVNGAVEKSNSTQTSQDNKV